ncbi:hypothetical protein PQG02_17365 [Nostoc sp. UHCC 0926]|uniref:hypothetical protein n=1 Tax=unclassified Nostoc TaxID=2593658 RepID=UPI00235F83AD|nr:hypothetical protein [Nostoc sp. UHCC 0926]WDD30537.1 hypothetical protein PQG02_17365 [Nostoc sp. UHCC 0926]
MQSPINLITAQAKCDRLLPHSHKMRCLRRAMTLVRPWRLPFSQRERLTPREKTRYRRRN